MVSEISAQDPYPRKRIEVEGTSIAYLDSGEGGPVVFLHGNPTSSYLWRNVIPHVEGTARFLAPDLVGMGDSGRAPDGSYRFRDHAHYMDAWFDALDLRDVVLVGHDWGGGLALHWASRHAERVAGIAYMETIVRPMEWDEWPESARKIFQAMRSPAGEELVLEKNIFVERILPSSVLRDLTEKEMDHYREPFGEPGEVRRPTLTWPRELPLGGEPADTVSTVGNYARWAAQIDVPKLFINADPGSILIGPQREFCRSWRKQHEVTVRGAHFIQEDSPAEIGQAIADFVRKIGSEAVRVP